MKSVRFSQVVAKCGHPETLLLFTDPKKDRALQAAVKAKRVMTVMQATVGTKTDWGEAGFHPGSHRQYLVFPKSLAAFAGKAVIGIKYDLLSEAESPRSRPHTPATKKPARKAPAPARPHKAAKPPAPIETETVPVEPPPPKEKQKPETKKEKDTPEVDSLKRVVKRAMQALEKGKQVAAFNLLRKIVDD